MSDPRLRECWEIIRSKLSPADAERLRTTPIEEICGLLAESYAREARVRGGGRSLRAELSHTVDHLGKVLEKVAGSHGIMLKVDQDAARNQMRRAEATLRETEGA